MEEINSIIVEQIKGSLQGTLSGSGGSVSSYLRGGTFVCTYGGSSSISTNSCREMVAKYIRKDVVAGDDRAQYLGFITGKGDEDIVRYLRTLEKSFNFKGDLTEDVCTLKGAKKGFNCQMHVLKLNKEWLLSPVLYQLMLLIVRIMIRSEAVSAYSYRELSTFDKEAPLGILEVGAGDASYKKYLLSAKSMVYMLLDKRTTLFSGTPKEEWYADKEDTEWGKSSYHDMRPYSGPTAFYDMVREVRGGGSALYFKCKSHKGIITKLFGEKKRKVLAEKVSRYIGR